MKKYLLGISFAALMVGGSAYAADVVQTYEAPEVAPVTTVAPAFGWDGFYVGGQIGGSWGSSDIDSRYRAAAGSGFTSGRLLSWSPDPDGFVGGLYAGYNFDLGNDIVVGLETDFVWGDVDDRTGYRTMDISFAGIGAGNNTYDTLTARAGVEQKWAGATRVRAGYAMDRFLPYVAAGVAYGKVKAFGNGVVFDSTGSLLPNQLFSVSHSDTMTGWTLGAGLDYAATDNVLVRFEYRYADYGDASYSYDFGTIGTTAVGDVKFELDHKTSDVRVGVAYKF